MLIKLIGRARVVANNLVVVTGAASGIGAAIAIHFQNNGWRVAGLDLNKSDTDYFFQVDVSDKAQIQLAVSKIENEIAPISVAISNAGHYEMKKITEVTNESLCKMLKVHLGGFRNIALSVLPKMRERKNGSLLCVTSELGIGGGESVSHYAAAKGTQIGLIRTLAVEYASFNVRVNGIAPGPTDTPLIPANSPERSDDFLKTIPIKRLVSAEEIAQATYFVAVEGTFFVGEIISPNGGVII